MNQPPSPDTLREAGPASGDALATLTETQFVELDGLAQYHEDDPDTSDIDAENIRTALAEITRLRADRATLEARLAEMKRERDEFKDTVRRALRLHCQGSYSSTPGQSPTDISRHTAMSIAFLIESAGQVFDRADVEADRDTAKATAEAAQAEIGRLRAENARLHANDPLAFLQAVQRRTSLPDRYRDAAAILMAGARDVRATLAQEAPSDG